MSCAIIFPIFQITKAAYTLFLIINVNEYESQTQAEHVVLQIKPAVVDHLPGSPTSNGAGLAQLPTVDGVKLAGWAVEDRVTGELSLTIGAPGHSAGGCGGHCMISDMHNGSNSLHTRPCNTRLHNLMEIKLVCLTL